MEREVLMTGIGGQGVQLAAQVLARAATVEGRNVLCYGLYGGMMRGGNTESTVVVADGPIESPPVVSRAWSAIAMHDEFWTAIAPRVRSGALVLVNASTFSADPPADATVHRVPASELAAGVDAPLGAAMAMIGAYCSMTGIVTADSLVAAMRASIPSYRTQHIAANERAIEAGRGAVEPGSFPAWDTAGARS